uniref:Sugar phosphate transporter domain-containing protein n=1 Tax=Sexangularia sp. CB-2014 TaxID=1486929 RepID=A0A7S1YIC0_9EUKA
MASSAYRRPIPNDIFAPTSTSVDLSETSEKASNRRKHRHRAASSDRQHLATTSTPSHQPHIFTSLLASIFSKGGFAIILWYTVNIFTVICNKWIYVKKDFTFPFTLTLCHMTAGFICGYLSLHVFRVVPTTIVSKEAQLSRVFPMATIFIVNIVLGNISLSYVPISFMQTIKSSVPAFTYFFQVAFLGRAFDGQLAATLIPIVGGVALTTWTEVNYDFIGFMTAFVASAVTATQAILGAKLLSGSLKMDSINLVYNMAPFAMVMLLPFVYAWEWDRLVAAWPVIGDSSLVALLVISSTVAFALNFAVFFAIKNTSALTFTVSGNFKVVLSVTISVLIFQNEVTLYNALGIIITILGCWTYNYMRHQLEKAPPMPLGKAANV